MSTILSLAPQNVWKHFYSLTQVPRPSGYLKKVQEFLLNFGKSVGVESFQDEAGNIIYRKPATPGMENRKKVILQAHMDMVPQKNNDTVHDFENDPIETYIDGDWVKAKGTTLGADDGMGVAAIMAIMEDKTLKHGPLEALITADEETGMFGAFGLKPGTVDGDILLNLDSEEEGELYIGCAGGEDLTAVLEYKEVETDPADIALKVTLKGLRGGHSGLEINEGRANANKLLIRVLKGLEAKVNFDVADITGGLKYNAIPRNAEAVVGISKADQPVLEKVLQHFGRIFSDEYRVNDPEIQVDYVAQDGADQVLCDDSKRRLLDYIDFTETGIVRMDQDYPQFVESSVSLGTIAVMKDRAELWVMTRSSKESQYKAMFQRIVSLTKAYDGIYEVMSDCPAWEFDSESQLKKKFEDVFRDLYGKDPSFMILHAGVEPSEFAKKIDRKLDMISLGPDIRDLHAPGEYVVISSTQRVWECFKRLIESL